MKYGSNYRIEIKGMWNETNLFTRTITLSDNINSKRALDGALNDIRDWHNSNARAAKLGTTLTDDDILELARQRNLIPPAEKWAEYYPKAELYFLESQSGKTKGHYIRKFGDGTVDCSCPGFVNNNKCWATTDIKNYPYDFVGAKWGATIPAFYTHAVQAYPEYKVR